MIVQFSVDKILLLSFANLYFSTEKTEKPKSDKEGSLRTSFRKCLMA